MASAKRDRRGYWTATCRRLFGGGRDRTWIRIPPERLRADHEAEDAAAFADECDQALRLLEDLRSLVNIRRARALRAITAAQEADLLAGIAAGPAMTAPAQVSAALSVLDAARMHPASSREIANDTTAAARHEAELLRFVAFCGTPHLHEVRLKHFTDYVRHLTAQGLSWDGRRHALLWPRRACRMGTSEGIPDVVGGLKLDHRPMRSKLVALTHWTLDELARACVRTTDPRLRVAIGLGGFLGLRPSEILRADVEHLTDDMLATGYKNVQSERLVPLPGFLREWIGEAIHGRKSGPIVQSKGCWGHGKESQRFNAHSFDHWFQPHMNAGCGKAISPKYLRKSYTAWAMRNRELSTQHLEALMGRSTALVSLVTGRHYLPELVARELRPTIAGIERIVTAALERARVDLKPIPITTKDHADAK